MLGQLSACAAALLLCGCSTSPVSIDAATDVPNRINHRGADLEHCGYSVATFLDRRPDGQASTLAGRAVVIDGIDARVRKSLEGYGVDVGGTERLELELLSAYGYSKATSMTFTTVLRTHVDGEPLLARGTHTTVNWASGNAEITKGLLTSVDAAAARLVELLAQACRSSHAG